MQVMMTSFNPPPQLVIVACRTTQHNCKISSPKEIKIQNPSNYPARLKGTTSTTDLRLQALQRTTTYYRKERVTRHI